MSLLAQGKKESSPTHSGCSIRTSELSQLATVTTASYEIQLGRSSTLWKDDEVYFRTDPTSPSYLLRVGHNCRFTLETVSITSAATPIFGQWTVYLLGCMLAKSYGWRLHLEVWIMSEAQKHQFKRCHVTHQQPPDRALRCLGN